MCKSFVGFVRDLKEMSFIKDYRVYDDGRAKIVFHVPLFRLSAYEEFFASLGMRVVDVEAVVGEDGNITLWLEEV